MRFVRNDVRDHVVSQKNDHGLSYWRYAASQRRTCPKINICEIFGVFRFSTFSTVSANRRHQARYLITSSAGGDKGLMRLGRSRRTQCYSSANREHRDWPWRDAAWWRRE